jgi:proteasome lid subunit RPN8/RPN11
VIRLSEAHLDHVKAEADAAYPSECCGLLVGNTNTTTVSRVVPSRNLLAGQGNDRFEIDPQIRINLERTLRGTSESIIGHYHSHPDHPAEPSKTDLEMAFEPELVWLIVSVSTGEATDVKAHQIDLATQKFVEIKCEILKRL